MCCRVYYVPTINYWAMMNDVSILHPLRSFNADEREAIDDPFRLIYRYRIWWNIVSFSPYHLFHQTAISRLFCNVCIR
jgi:hypothetical protein